MQPGNTDTGGQLCNACNARKAERSGICADCQVAKFAQSRRKYPRLSPLIEEELRLAYVGNVREVSANLKRLSARTGIPKDRLKYEANRRGWRCIHERRAWTAEEVQRLRDALGTASVRRIARGLKRSAASVTDKAMKLNLSIRLREGYNISDLCEVFGVHRLRVEGWAKRGFLGKSHGHGGHGGDIRFTESNVVKFIREHPTEYDLGRVDQVWFKSMLFGECASYGDRV